MVDPDLLVIFGGIIATTIGYQISRAIRARMERPSLSRSDLADVKSHLERLEQAVDSIAIEVERISEGQRFTTKLLSERAASPSETEPPSLIP
jgi:hypothetical protein